LIHGTQPSGAVSLSAPFWVLPSAIAVAAGLTLGTHLLLESDYFLEDSSDHTLFFVPIKWWPVLFLVIAVLFLAQGL
jgi:hypothetical protein